MHWLNCTLLFRSHGEVYLLLGNSNFLKLQNLIHLLGTMTFWIQAFQPFFSGRELQIFERVHYYNSISKPLSPEKCVHWRNVPTGKTWLQLKLLMFLAPRNLKLTLNLGKLRQKNFKFKWLKMNPKRAILLPYRFQRIETITRRPTRSNKDYSHWGKKKVKPAKHLMIASTLWNV